MTDALLGDWVDRLGTFLTDPDLLAILRAYTHTEHRRWQPLWERKACGARVRMAGVTVADGITLQEALADHRSAEDLALSREIGDERIRAVLRSLDTVEAAVAWAYAEGTGAWPDAARATGNTEQFGERVRRKLHRLGDRHNQRAMAAAR
ncbi:hypothetical protein ACFVSN_31015 [Kitasatospora sp. NPDC057904]|uniref:hypothetical protein n=1 Tax=Kitasatospora sp. NPDC057904 TaxID=3346275 RepID=UPI0036DD17DA